MADEPFVSVVVPVWNDHDSLSGLLGSFPDHEGTDMIVVVAREEERRYETLEHRFTDVRWVTAPRGRGGQMDAGAAAARGQWLLFLHADCRLPSDWFDVIRSADHMPRVVGGAFRFALDSRDWRARLLEFGVRLRVALFDLPYGDQALFVRRSVFEAVGGFRRLPLMEDVDLVRRLRRDGRLFFARSAVTSSARRWERDGWVRRSGSNLVRLMKYFAGTDPVELVHHYEGRQSAAIVLMARAPWREGKTRLKIGDDVRHAELRRALFEDTLDAVRSVSQADHIIACEPAGEAIAMRELVGPACEVVGQHGESLGDRLQHAFEDGWQQGYRSVVIVGSDIPDLPRHSLQAALRSLSGGTDHLVIGPAGDGGYYLIGLNRLHRELFRDIDWGTDRVLRQTLARAADLALLVVRLDEWNDVDNPEDLGRFAGPGVSARRTREWITRGIPSRDGDRR